MMAAGFYKFENDILRYAARSVYAPNFTLKVEDHLTYTYPFEGWHYFKTTTDAEAYFELNGRSQAEWVSFGAAVQLDPGINHLLGIALQQLPALGMGLGVGLGKAADGDSRVFTQAWSAARAAGLVPPELQATMVAMAQMYHLPGDFVAALEGGGEN